MKKTVPKKDSTSPKTKESNLPQPKKSAFEQIYEGNAPGFT